MNPSVPAKNVKELIAYAKANAGKLSYGSAGTGTMSHLSGELFKQITGLTDLAHVPYKGAGPGIADLVSGHIPIMTPNVTGQLLGFHKAGKIRILAVNSPSAPEGRARTFRPPSSRACPDMVGQLFLGMFAPAATPKPAVERDGRGDQEGGGEAEAFQKVADRLRVSRPVPYFSAGRRPALHGRGVRALEAGRCDAIGLKTHSVSQDTRRRDALLRQLAQRRAVDLVGRGERQFVDEPDEARVLIGRRVGERVLLDRRPRSACGRPSG